MRGPEMEPLQNPGPEPTENPVVVPLPVPAVVDDEPEPVEPPKRKQRYINRSRFK